MKGTYILLLRLSSKRKIHIGRLGKLEFNKGYYAYVGSAMNGLEARIGRHLESNKKLYWHIDYLLENAGNNNIYGIYYKPSKRKKNECEFASMLNSQFEPVNDFGSSDCNCKSHLFYCESHTSLRGAIIRSKAIKYKGTHQNERR